MSKKVKIPVLKYNLVRVIWDDATSISQGWKTKEDFDKEEIKPEIVMSVGFLVKDSENHIILAMDTDSDGDHASRSQIPKGMIKSIKILKKAEIKGELLNGTSTSPAVAVAGGS